MFLQSGSPLTISVISPYVVYSSAPVQTQDIASLSQ